MAGLAPSYPIIPRTVVAVEHPMIIRDIDNGLKTFGKGKPFERILHAEDPDGCLPLYLRHGDPMCVPILSRHSSTNNLLLKVTVPKRTGRKRKLGSDDPYIGDAAKEVNLAIQSTSLESHSGNDSPRKLIRVLKDNADTYKIEVVAEIQQTHRFRGLADFHHSTANTEFMSKVQDYILPGEVEKMRQFKFDPSRGWKKNEQFMPPPVHTNHTLPFNWAWHQNPHITTRVDEDTGQAFLVNRSKSRKYIMDYLSPNVESIPPCSPYPVPKDPAVLEAIEKLTELMNERPMWTRRALGNCLGNQINPLRIQNALHHVGYQFKGGPFRDAVIKYGVDPRTDKKYRIYQTIFFKLFQEEEKTPFMPWQDVRTGFSLSRNTVRADTTTHLFDGKTLTLDGKIWQLCDITDPILVGLIGNSTPRDDFNPKTDGWFSNGAWAKIRAIMKTKLVAIRAHRTISDDDFKATLDYPDVVDDNKRKSQSIQVPVPDIRLTESEVQELVNKGQDVTIFRGSGIRKRNAKIKMRNARIERKRGNLLGGTNRGPKYSIQKGGRKVGSNAMRLLREEKAIGKVIAKAGTEINPKQSQESTSNIFEVDNGDNGDTRLQSFGTIDDLDLAGEADIDGDEEASDDLEDEDEDDDEGAVDSDLDDRDTDEDGEEDELSLEGDEEDGDEDDLDEDADVGSVEGGENDDSDVTDIVDFQTYYRPRIQ